MRRALPLAVILGVIGALLWYGDAPRVFTTIGRFQLIYLVWLICLRLAHEALRGAIWLILIKALSLGVPVRTQVFAFAAAEAVNVVPLGTYLENAVLQRSAGSAFGRSSAATTFMILGEIAAGLLGVAVLGVGGWSAWLRLAILAVIAAVLLAVLSFAARGNMRLPQRLRERKVVIHVLDELQRFRAGAAALLRPPILGVTLVFCMLYVLVSGTALFVVVRALSIGNVSYWQAVAAACFGLGFYPVLGSLEAAEVVIFVGMGLNKSAAVGAVLLNRALDICLTISLAILVMAILRDQWRAIRRPQVAQDPDATAGR